MPKHKVTFLPGDVTVEVDPVDYPLGTHGEPGSILDVALSADLPIEHACGGVGVCATCHVIVERGMENLSEPDDEELDCLDQAAGVTLNSRLACRAVVKGNVTVTIPRWNRNAVSERG